MAWDVRGSDDKLVLGWNQDFVYGGGRRKRWEFGRPCGWEALAAVVATKTDGRGCVCEQLDIFWFGDVVIIKEEIVAWSIVVYCIEKSGLGIKLLMLETVEPWGDETSMISLFFPEYFLVTVPIGLILNVGKGGLENGPIMNDPLTSLSRSLSTMLGSVIVAWVGGIWRNLQTWVKAVCVKWNPG